jgi:hypothetical protein
MPRPQKGKDGQELEIATMRSDPAGPYGEWVFELGLSEAVERGVLAGFEIDVLEIRDPSRVRWSIFALTRRWCFLWLASALVTGLGAAQGPQRAGSSAAHCARPS